MLVYLSMIEMPEAKDKFERLYLKYRHLMLHIANSILGNRQDAEDAVHEAFVAIIRNLEKFSDTACPETQSLVVIIVERKAIDILRKQRRQKRAAFHEDISGVEIPAPGDHGLADAMARLPAHYRAVLLMRYDNGLTSKEIGQLLDISQSGVRKQLKRAKQALQSELEKEDITL